jgi:hypothetical protein
VLLLHGIGDIGDFWQPVIAPPAPTYTEDAYDELNLVKPGFNSG